MASKVNRPPSIPQSPVRTPVRGKSASAPGQMKRAAGAKSAKAYAPGQTKKRKPDAFVDPMRAKSNTRG